MYHMKFKLSAMTILLLANATAFAAPASNHDVPIKAKVAITAGNQAWVAGMKRGDAAMIANIFTTDAVDCGSKGACLHGRAAILKQLQTEFAKYGAARVATVHSLGAVRDGNLIYEWGTSGTVIGNGQVAAGRYLAIWRHQADGNWKLYRNLMLPNPAV